MVQDGLLMVLHITTEYCCRWDIHCLSCPVQMMIEKFLLKITTKSKINNVLPEPLLTVYLAHV